MENDVVGNRVCSTESVNGSRDVWSCKDADSASADHLIVMVNGILGRLGYSLPFLFFTINFY